MNARKKAGKSTDKPNIVMNAAVQVRSQPNVETGTLTYSAAGLLGEGNRLHPIDLPDAHI